MTTETLMTGGANTTPAATSTASDATPEVVTQVVAPEAAPDANQQTSTETTETTEVKTEDAAPPEKVVPEKYEFTKTEGVELDAELIGEFEGIAKELKLSQEEAQKVNDLGVKLAQKFATQQATAIEEAAATWIAESTSDKEFGGDKLTASLAQGKKALDTFGTPELRTLLEQSRLGNHPEVIRFMSRAGKALSEDRMVTGGAGPSSPAANAAKTLYPNQS